jgi:hypothetical protein
MSQYPSPYQTPHAPMQHYASPIDPLGASKRASLLLFILGPLGLLLGACLFSMPLLIKAAPGPQADQLRDKVMQSTHMPAETIFPAMGAIFVVPALLMLIFAFFVRRGNRGATATSCALMGVLLAFWLVNTIGGMFLQPMDARSAFGLCINVVLLAVFGLELFWLIAALRGSKNAQIAQQQYAAQYWQYQQAMQAYAYGQQQQGYPAPTNLPQGYATGPSPAALPDNSNPSNGE